MSTKSHETLTGVLTLTRSEALALLLGLVEYVYLIEEGNIAELLDELGWNAGESLLNPTAAAALQERISIPYQPVTSTNDKGHDPSRALRHNSINPNTYADSRRRSGFVSGFSSNKLRFPSTIASSMTYFPFCP